MWRTSSRADEMRNTIAAHQRIEDVMYTLKLSGPGKNALSTTMMESILAQLDSAQGQPILLTGDGDSFSSGLDLKEIASLDKHGIVAFLRLLERCMSALYLHRAPTVAAVNGHAIAGGCVLTLCCDHRVMTTSARARIGLNEVALGLRYPPRVFRIVRKRVPAHTREQVVLGADLFDAPGALKMGLVDELAEDPVAAGTARLAKLAAHPTEGYAEAKRALRGAREQDLASDDALDEWFRGGAADAWTSAELKQRIATMFTRR